MISKVAATRLVNGRRTVSLLAAATLVLVLACLGGCSGNAPADRLKNLVTQNAHLNPSQFLLDKLATHRIVMLADTSPGDSQYLQTITEMLDHWTVQLESSEPNTLDIPTRVVLILELNQAAQDRLRAYWSSADPFHLISLDGFASPQFTTQELEFYSDLGRIREKVPTLPGDIHFDVLGFEPTKDITQLSQNEQAQYLLFQRDEQASASIIQYLNEHPDTRALLFYDREQLLRESTTKQSGPYAAPGHYIAHYLAAQYESDEASTAWIR